MMMGLFDKIKKRKFIAIPIFANSTGTRLDNEH